MNNKIYPISATFFSMTAVPDMGETYIHIHKNFDKDDRLKNDSLPIVPSMRNMREYMYLCDDAFGDTDVFGDTIDFIEDLLANDLSDKRTDIHPCQLEIYMWIADYLGMEIIVEYLLDIFNDPLYWTDVMRRMNNKENARIWQNIWKNGGGKGRLHVESVF